MIVECDQCSTRFQLDDTRVPDKGIRVRCSRCKHAFFLHKPGVGEEEAIDDVAQAAARDPEASAPEPTSDLDAAPAEEAEAPAPGAHEEDVDEESDWEFNTEVPEDDDSEPEVDAGAAAALAAEESDFEDSDADISLAGDPTPSAPPEHPASFGSISIGDDDTSDPSIALADDPAPQPEAPEPEAPETAPGSEAASQQVAADDDDPFGSVEDFSSLGVEDEEEVAAAAAAEAESASAPIAAETPASESDELGDPENWDFFSDGAATPPRPTAAPAVASGATDDLVEALAEPGAAHSSIDADHGPSVIDMRRPGPPIGAALGWLLVIALAAAAVARGLGLGDEVMTEPVATLELDGWTAANLEATWIETARSGVVLAVSGELRRAGAEGGDAWDLAVALRDAQGRPLEPSAALHAPIPPRMLRELSPEAIGRAQAEARALWRRGTSTSKRFQALLREVPVEAERFDLVRVVPVPIAEAVAPESPDEAGDETTPLEPVS